MNLSEKAIKLGMKAVYSYLDRDPTANIPKILDWLLEHDIGKGVTKQVVAVKEAIADPNSNWSKLIKSLWTDIDAGQRKVLFENFVVNGSMIGTPIQTKVSEQYDCNVPWAILMDPTSACNLKCTGCWAAQYGNKMNLSFDELDNIINQGKAHGTYVYLYSGGEPLIRKDDIIKLCEKHNDCAFLAFTNGTLIDEEFAKEMLRVKNFVPCISVEGFEDATDFRRGKGTYQKIIRAMDILREHKLAFGISCCYTSKNVDVIGSEEYFDEMIKRGAKFAWFFTYMPIGADAVPELMVTPEQRKFMYHQIRKFRKEKPIFTLDFWNDGQFVGGCIAAGRAYIHINANGDIEPCAFVHYSDSNIREKTLLEAYQSPLFKAYRARQPFNDNMLRPCPVLDNYGRLAEMVEETGAKSTDLKCPENARDYCDKCKTAAEKWAPVADELWKEIDYKPITSGKLKPHKVM
ncbi:radical SAM domain protein [Thermoclostridium stercorarium subsp. stercorarium DSM 8532]|uniref:Radical SAM domain protein n=3 Tax=Thermoclostridium stercorarium TaxID=1510 RepID=L7VUN2_THES1|nr:radical SAM protein [Thermoclostridium stercorarium]AGC69298.1 radical SAM domain protein [Thermoclostridium stercorarium subsp. stercorarium DSM 8532]AGI40262.1 Fe-S oxidoreductase [Thermoclostridium stercorarium subsp. stercorarium DSM 8532]ANW99562.1 radical SAM protein [Thermoclostridium stercorarium subsp. thermolacticum DSM 2910]ANX02192.1 radical SAM protein [Thermoclostridium stercorarium subsp. leptospartum DSM 9219]UZQ85266.1 radical SAM protein [Thermoclostridium stercorarium]